MPDNLDTPYTVHELNEDGTPGTHVGGAHDDVSAAIVACAVFASLQEYSASVNRKIVVLDRDGATRAFVGRNI